MTTLFASLEDFESIAENVIVEEPTEVTDVMDTTEVSELETQVTEDVAVTADESASIESYIQVTASMESMYETLKQTLATGGMDQPTAKMMNHALEGYAIALGTTYQEYMLPSVENFGDSSSRLLSTEISLEGVGESIRNAGKYVWDKLVKMWNWITERVTGLFNPLKALYNKVDALERMLRDKGFTIDGMYSIPTYMNDLVKSGTLNEQAFTEYSNSCLKFIEQITKYEDLASTLEKEQMALQSAHDKEKKKAVKQELQVKIDAIVKEGQSAVNIAGSTTEHGVNFLGGKKSELTNSAKENAGKVSLTAAKILGFVRTMKEFIKKALTWKTYTDKFAKLREKFKSMTKPVNPKEGDGDDQEVTGIWNKTKSVFSKFGNFFHHVWVGLVKKVTGAYKWLVGLVKREGKDGEAKSEEK